MSSKKSPVSIRPEELKHYFRELSRTGSQEIREKLVESHLNLVHFFTRRFAVLPEYREDLQQVATLGLINAVDRFDPDRGVEFITFATITIVGEIKRYFRDKTWSLKVPRRIKDLNILINNAIEKLAKEQDHAPTYSEIADEVGISVEDIIESREAIQSYHPVSLDREIDTEVSDASTTLMDMIGNIDKQLDMLSERLSLQSSMKRLPDDERFVIYHRFFTNLSQAQIAKMLNVSQMQVSRLQNQALGKLKRLLSK
ncbi:MAG: SigB/SigF/SigG family RNA polymerase sigma factor [bacterium]